MQQALAGRGLQASHQEGLQAELEQLVEPSAKQELHLGRSNP